MALKNEFLSIPTNLQQRERMLIAQRNCSKNRYCDILPFDDNCVMVNNGRDYVNASYINGMKNKQYIAAQAPTPACFESFWQMTWETKAPVIFMLTKFVEGNKIKSHCYFPKVLGETEVFGNLQVTLSQSPNEKEGCILRLFTIQNLLTGESRDVAHVHYTLWPDYGVPATTHGIKKLLSLMSYYKNEENPMIIHCSAGIGRTGVLITLHTFFSALQSSIHLPIPKIIQFLRLQRAGLVQSVSQYEFIYKVIHEVVGMKFKTPRSVLRRTCSTTTSNNTNIGAPIIVN